MRRDRGQGEEAMRGIPWILPFALLATGSAQAAATVTFVQPQAFTDADLHGRRPPRPDSPALAGIRRHLERLGRRLPGDQVLRIEILDVDLAGTVEPWRPAASPVRHLTPASWPRIRLRYVLEQGGQPILHGEDTLLDRFYLQRSTAVLSTDPLRFEQTLLSDWFDRRFPAVRGAGGPGGSPAGPDRR